MKPTYSISLSISLAVFLSIASGKQVLAAPVKFTPTGMENVGEIICTAPVRQIGDYSPDHGSATIRGNQINIEAVRGYYNERFAALSGEVFDTECDTSHSPLTLTGLAFFNRGSVLNKMDNSDEEEFVFAKQSSVRGRIVHVNSMYVVVQKRDGSIEQVDRNLVILIRSPRAYRFTMAATVNGALRIPIEADVQQIDFKPTLRRQALPSGSVIPHPVDKDDDDDDLGKLL